MISSEEGIIDPSFNGIRSSISKAFKVLGEKDEVANRLAGEIVKKLEDRYAGWEPSAADVRDLIRRALADDSIARVLRPPSSESPGLTECPEMVKRLAVVEVVNGYLNQQDWRVRENSNSSYSLSGLLLHLSGSVVANYALNSMYPMEVSQAHADGAIHIHDLSMGVGAYCAGWSLQKLLAEGFNGVPNRVASKPPAHLGTALLQMVNFLGTMQNEFAGAQALNSLDTYLAPFVRSDGLDYRDVKQAVQTFVFNLNIASRWGGQTPFTNVTLDWTTPDHMKGEHVIIRGELLDNTYGDYQEEAQMINKAFIEVMTEGDMNGRPFTFPIPTYNITSTFPWGGGVHGHVVQDGG